MPSELTIGYSPITERIYLGRIKPNERDHWTGDKTDITSRFIEVLLQKFEPGFSYEIGNADKHYRLTVEEWPPLKDTTKGEQT